MRKKILVVVKHFEFWHLKIFWLFLEIQIWKKFFWPQSLVTLFQKSHVQHQCSSLNFPQLHCSRSASGEKSSLGLFLVIFGYFWQNVLMDNAKTNVNGHHSKLYTQIRFHMKSNNMGNFYWRENVSLDCGILQKLKNWFNSQKERGTISACLFKESRGPSLKVPLSQYEESRFWENHAIWGIL